MFQQLIPTGEQSGLWMHFAATESPTRCADQKPLRRGATIQGASGVFNERLTDADVNFIKSGLRKLPVAEQSAARAAEEPKIKNLFRLIDSDVVESLKRILPSLGLRRFNGENFPAEYDAGYGGTVILCRDEKNDNLVVVDFNRGDAPTVTLIRILRYMSWARQNLAGKNDLMRGKTHTTQLPQ